MSEKTRKCMHHPRRLAIEGHKIPLCEECYLGGPDSGHPQLPRRRAANGFDIRATLRRVLPEGSTIWTVTQHVTRSGRVTVLPMAFEAAAADPRGELGLTIASCRYVLGREFCEKLGYRWDNEHMGWIGDYGEDASSAIVAALSMATYDRPDAYSLGRTA